MNLSATTIIGGSYPSIVCGNPQAEGDQWAVVKILDQTILQNIALILRSLILVLVAMIILLVHLTSDARN